MKDTQTRLVRSEGVKLACPKCNDILFLREKSRHIFYCPSCFVAMEDQ